MDRNAINISKIETFFDKLLRNKLSKNIFFTDAPNAIMQEWDEMIVVNCEGITDWDAYGRGTILVFMYVPPMKASERKNVAKFSELESKLNACIEGSHDDVYKIERATTYSDYDERMKMFVNIVAINLMVLT